MFHAGRFVIKVRPWGISNIEKGMKNDVVNDECVRYFRILNSQFICSTFKLCQWQLNKKRRSFSLLRLKPYRTMRLLYDPLTHGQPETRSG